MLAGNYIQSRFGRPAREPGNAFSFTYFAAEPLPRDLHVSEEAIAALSEADHALGRLDGFAAAAEDRGELVQGALLREAVASTRPTAYR